MKKFYASSLWVVVGVLPALGASAHHSFAMFDNSKPTTIEGTVKEFQWTNPHTFIEVMVKDKAGNVVQWSIEGAPTTSLKRRGWTRNSLQPGDRVTVVVFPLRSGAPGGGLDKVTKDGVPVGTVQPN